MAPLRLVTEGEARSTPKDRQHLLDEALEANRAVLRVSDTDTPFAMVFRAACRTLERHGARTIVERRSDG